jgi:hypothetical protein
MISKGFLGNLERISSTPQLTCAPKGSYCALSKKRSDSEGCPHVCESDSVEKRYSLDRTRTGETIACGKFVCPGEKDLAEYWAWSRPFARVQGTPGIRRRLRPRKPFVPRNFWWGRLIWPTTNRDLQALCPRASETKTTKSDKGSPRKFAQGRNVTLQSPSQNEQGRWPAGSKTAR